MNYVINPFSQSVYSCGLIEENYKGWFKGLYIKTEILKHVEIKQFSHIQQYKVYTVELLEVYIWTMYADGKTAISLPFA